MALIWVLIVVPLPGEMNVRLTWVNPYLTNGLAFKYHLGESTVILAVS